MSEFIQGLAGGVARPGRKPVGAGTMLFAAAGLCFAVAIFSTIMPANTAAEGAGKSEAAAVARELDLRETCQSALQRKYPRAKWSAFATESRTFTSGDVDVIVDVKLPALGGDSWAPATWLCSTSASTGKTVRHLLSARK